MNQTWHGEARDVLGDSMHSRGSLGDSRHSQVDFRSRRGSTASRRSSNASSTAPEPPRWRFVKEAKSTLGYSSLHAGSYIRGQSSQELGAKYVAPDISLYKPKREKVTVKRTESNISDVSLGEQAEDEVDVGKVEVAPPTSTPFIKDDAEEVGKLQINDEDNTMEESFSGYFAGLPNTDTVDKSSPEFKEWVKFNGRSPKDEREGEWYNGSYQIPPVPSGWGPHEREDTTDYTLPIIESPDGKSREVGKLAFHRPDEGEEVFVGEIPKIRNSPDEEQGEGGDCTDLGHNHTDYDERLNQVGMEDQGGDGVEVVDQGHAVDDHDDYDDFLSFVSGKSRGNTVDTLPLDASGSNDEEEGLFEDNKGDEEDGFDDNEVSEDPAEEEKRKRKRRFLPLLLLCCCLIPLAIIGAVLGRKKKEGSEDTTSAVLIPPNLFDEDGGLEEGAGAFLIPPPFIVVNTTMPSTMPSLQHSASPSLAPSEKSSHIPSSTPTYSPSLTPSTSPPTRSPVFFLGPCPEWFEAKVFSSYTVGDQVAVDGLVYECKSDPTCGSYYFGNSLADWLWDQGWEAVGSCVGTKPPTASPSLSPSISPTKSPSESPSRTPTASPSFSPTPRPTNRPTTLPPTPPPSDLPSTSPTCSGSKFNVCFALDLSGSVCEADFDDDGCKDYEKMKKFSMKMVEELDKIDAVEKRYSIVQFADDARVVSELSAALGTITDLEKLDYTGGWTNTAAAFNECQSTFDSSAIRRKNFIIMITDGVPTVPGNNPSDDAEDAATRVKTTGTTIIPIFIQKVKNNDDDALDLMDRFSSEGKYFDISDFDSLDLLQERLVDEVSCE